MRNYSDNLLWNLTLEQNDDKNEHYRKKLRESFESTRKNVIKVLEQIRKDFPFLTLHDISHSDFLWHTASVIIGRDNYPINPLEGFILGCAFLVHDAALSYEAYGGVDNLRGTVTWKDCFAELCKKKTIIDVEDLKKKADFWSVRLLHADESKNLLSNQFKNNDGTSFYLIEDESLREHLANLIGEIASSHHWSYEELNKLQGQFNSMPFFPRGWRVNPKKLSCILRCADAAHIDNGRAPDHLFRLLKINGVSYNHWKAQNCLAQIDKDASDDNKVIITSTIDFIEDEFASWNVAFDAVSVLNNELKASNRLLKNIDPEICFQAKEVTGANSREEMSHHIRVKGWKPCEANVKISNVAELIANLGGSNLYGSDDNILVVLRELIQNARDAIKARINYDMTFHNGHLLVEVSEENGSFFISILDNGIGMSNRTITTSFLDFGSSFWASDLAKKEFPGLRASSFNSVGQYGIGFYSVFMVASQVTIESRRFDDALDNTTVLKFPSGITLNPIFSTRRGTYTNYSTIIRFKIDENKYQWNEQYTIKRNTVGDSDFEVPFYAVLQSLCAGLDVDVYYKGIGADKRLIHHDIESNELDKREWLMDISFANFLNDAELVHYIDENFKRLDFIFQDENIVGLAAIDTFSRRRNKFLGVSTIGGLSTDIHRHGGNRFMGFFDYKPDSAKRMPSKHKKANNENIILWATKQYEKILLEKPNILILHHLQYELCEYYVDPINICTAYISDAKKFFRIINLTDLINEIVLNGKRLIILLFSFNADHMELHFDVEKIYEKLQSNDILFYPTNNGDFLKVELSNNIPVNNYSFIDCLNRKSISMSAQLQYSTIQEYAPSMLSGMCPALMIEGETSFGANA